MKLKKILIIGGSVFIVLIATLVIYFYKSYAFMFETEVEKIDENFIVFKGGGGNSCIINGDNLLIVVDTKMMGASEDLYKMAKEKAGSKKIIVINTHYHGDHVKGNHYYTGSQIFIGNYDKAFLNKEITAENMPTNIIKDSITFSLGIETVTAYNLGQAHTFNDVVLYLKNRKTMIVGDLVFNQVDPVLKKESGANVDKWLAVLQRITTSWDIKTIIPGHGKTGGTEIAKSLMQYFLDMKDAAANPAKEGEMKTKYKDWMEMPGMASPTKTIEYIRGS